MSGQNVHNKWTRTLAATAKCDWCSSKNLILQRCGVCHINVCQECMAKGVLEDNQHQVARSAVGDWDWEKPQGSGSQYSAQGRDRGTARSVVSRENGVHSSQSPRPSPWLEHAPVVHSPAPSAFPVFRNNPRGYFGGPQMALGSEAGRPTMMPDPGFVQTLQRPGYYGVPERMSQAWFGPTASYPSWNRPFIRRGQTSNQKHAQKQPNEAPQSSRQPAHTLNSLLPSMSPTTTKKRSRPQTPSDEGVMGEDSGRRSAVRRKSENVQCETVSAGKRPEDHSAENISLNSKPSENTAPEKRPSTQSPTAVKEISEKLPENTSCITEHLDKDDASLDKHDKEAAMILVAMSRGLHQLEAHTEDREARRSPPNADDTSGKTPEDDDPSSSSPCQLLSQLSSEASGASATPRALSHGSSQTARTGESTHTTASNSNTQTNQLRHDEHVSETLAHSFVFAEFGIDPRLMCERDEQGKITTCGKALHDAWFQIMGYLAYHFSDGQVPPGTNQFEAAWSHLMVQMRDDTPGNVSRAVAISVYLTIRQLLQEAMEH